MLTPASDPSSTQQATSEQVRVNTYAQGGKGAEVRPSQQANAKLYQNAKMHMEMGDL